MPDDTELLPCPAPPPASSLMHRRQLVLAGAFASIGGPAALTACGGGGGGVDPAPPPAPAPAPPPVVIDPVDGPAWPGFGRSAQHGAQSGIATQPLARIVWRAPVDLAPPYNSGGALLGHYGSPLCTRRNTVVLPVKQGGPTAFRVEARIGQTGGLIWQLNSDYRFPPYHWLPGLGLALAPEAGGNNEVRVLIPSSGGRLIARGTPDAASGSVSTFAFYGDAAYAAAAATFDATVFINTPITTDSRGNAWFGYVVTGANPAGLAGGGIARVAADGSGSWVAAAAASADAALVKTAMNCAPALSADEGTLYVVVNSVPVGAARARGQLLALDANTLATRARIALTDPVAGTPAWINDNATSSPLVGPDGDVFIGVLEANPPAHNFRGWLLHFDAGLTQVRAPGNFGWDNTPSVVPAAMVPQYTGASSYLLATKANDYGGIGTGAGQHRVAIVDPQQTEPDAHSTAQVMRQVISVLSITPDPRYPGGLKEWCINSAACDPATSSILMNNEDGYLYRWHLPSNTLAERISLNNGYLQAYTPTVVGADGRVYAVNNGEVVGVGR